MTVISSVSDRSPAGTLNRRVGLSNPGAPVPDGDGSFTTPYAPLVSSAPDGKWWAGITDATTKNLERIAATLIGVATHLVTIRYNAGVALKTRVTYGTRVFDTIAIANQDERNIEQTLICAEVVS